MTDLAEEIYAYAKSLGYSNRNINRKEILEKSLLNFDLTKLSTREIKSLKAKIILLSNEEEVVEYFNSDKSMIEPSLIDIFSTVIIILISVSFILLFALYAASISSMFLTVFAIIIAILAGIAYGFLWKTAKYNKRFECPKCNGYGVSLSNRGNSISYCNRCKGAGWIRKRDLEFTIKK